MIEQTLSQLRQLKLTGMAGALQTQKEQVGNYEGLAFTERLQLLVDQEAQERQQRKQERLIRIAQFKLKAQNLLLTGPCGSGKRYIACAVGHQACLKGYSTKYYRLSRLILALTQAKADGSYSKLLKMLAHFNLLIIDDWGLETLKAATRNDLMEIMDDRHEHSSTVMINQLPTDQWYRRVVITPSQMQF